PLEIARYINMSSYRIDQTSSGRIPLVREEGGLHPIGGLGTAQPRTEDLTALSEILDYINQHFGTDFTDADKLAHFSADMERRMTANPQIRLALDTQINPS